MIKHEKETTEDDNKKEVDFCKNETGTKNSPNEKPNICEFEIYKQAAEIEKHLKEDKP